MATGMHSETHGVLDNHMFGSEYETMHYTYEQFHYDEKVVPIWIQNENNGDERYSGVMMWPGSQFEYQKKKPTYIQEYDSKIDWSACIKTIISWIKDETKPANLVYAYFDEPDKTAHNVGGNKEVLEKQIKKVDITVKYMLEQIKNEGLQDIINLIIVSDHGMDTVKYENTIHLNYLRECKAAGICQHIVKGPNAFVHPKEGKFNEVHAKLLNASKESNNFQVYKQEDIPERWHMKNNSRLYGIIYLLANNGYVFWGRHYEQLLSKKFKTKDKFQVGVHGYDNTYDLMNGIFIASGPMFKENFIAEPFDNVDLYPLVSCILQLDETNYKVNGTITNVQQLLDKSQPTCLETA